MCTGLVSSIAFYFSCRFVSQRQWVWWSGSPCITLQQTALNDSIAVHLIELCDRSVAEEFGYQAFVVNLKHNAFHNLYPELKNQFQSWPDFSRVVIRKAVQEFRTITTAVPFFLFSLLCIVWLSLYETAACSWCRLNGVSRTSRRLESIAGSDTHVHFGCPVHADKMGSWQLVWSVQQF